MNNNPTTLTKFLNSINNTLNIANKVMPIYKEAKPIIQTVTKTYNNIKNNKTDLSNILKIIKINTNTKKEINNNSIKDNIKQIENKNYNNPKFFI